MKKIFPAIRSMDLSKNNVFIIFVIAIMFFMFNPCLHCWGDEKEYEYYTVHVASFKNFNGAKKTLNSLKANSHDAFYEAVELPGKGKWYRVYAGKYESKKEALQEANKIREKVSSKTLVIKKTGQKIVTSTAKFPKSLAEIKPQTAKKDKAPHKSISRNKTVPKEIKEENKKQSELYRNAFNDFESGNYENAIKKFNNIIKHNSLKAKETETVRRYIADSYYFLGEKGNGQYCMIAIDQYRNLIRNYQKSKKKNMLANYRLAESYVHVKMYYEALAEYEKFCSAYPNSIYVSDAAFMVGKIFYQLKKFDKAVEKFKEYIERFQDGEHIKDAYFYIGDCYSQMCRYIDANKWYDKALEKWPDLDEIPKDILANLGSFFFNVRNYNNAEKCFFVYLNLFPDEKQCKDVFFKLGTVYVKTGQTANALKILSIIIEKYPGSLEAHESAVLMANIGVEHEAIEIPSKILCGMNYYLHPIKTYNESMQKSFDLMGNEELAYRKAYAYMCVKDYRKAFEVYRSFFNAFPCGAYTEHSKKSFIKSASCLVDNFYSKKDYVAVSEIYFDTYKNGLFENADFEMLSRILTGLEKVGLTDPAINVFKEITRRFKHDGRITDLLIGIAEMDCKQGLYEKAEKRLETVFSKKKDLDRETNTRAQILMGDVCFKAGHYEKAARFYSEVLSSDKNIKNVASVYKNYAETLKGMGLGSSAIVNYKRAVGVCVKEKNLEDVLSVIVDSYGSLGDYFLNEGKYAKSISMYDKLFHYLPESKQAQWTLFNVGRAYLNLCNITMAEKSFNLLKQNEDDEFWSGLVEYCLHDAHWKENYGHYLPH